MKLLVPDQIFLITASSPLILPLLLAAKCLFELGSPASSSKYLLRSAASSAWFSLSNLQQVKRREKKSNIVISTI
ncbi:hypothetical protein Hanom_Chr11g01043301 [Helianthus anomalus]